MAMDRVQVSSMFMGPDFDSDALVRDAVASGKSPTDIARIFYGDSTDRVLKEASVARGRPFRAALGQTIVPPAVSSVPSMSAQELRSLKEGRDTHSDHPGRFDLPYDVKDNRSLSALERWYRRLKAAFSGDQSAVRSNADALSGSAVILDDGSWAHEITGHLMNPVVNTRQESDRAERYNSDGRKYYIANDSELAAALGNLRKQVFKRTGGKVDVKDPAALRDVFLDYATNPEAYKGKWLSHDARALLMSWTDVPANLRINGEILDRKADVHKILGDPDFVNKVVMSGRTGGRTTRAAAKGGNTSGASGVRQAAGGGATKISYEDLRKLADTTYKGDVRAAVYSLDPKVVTATVDSFGGNIDRTNRPMYVHRDKDGKATGYSTTNSGDALDRGVKPGGRFQSVLVPFVRQGKDGPEYTEDYNVAQKWYDESGQHYGKFDMDFTTPEAKARSIDRFNAASWLVHREQQLRYQPEFDRLVEAERRQAAKAGDAGRSKSSKVPSGHNPALDGYTGPRIIVNPEVMHDKRDALCVAYNEAIRIFMETNEYEPQSEPTEKQRRFFADTPYADDELQLRRTILARICVFDTSVKDPTDDQLSESASVLRAIIDSGFAKTDDEIEKCERLARAIEAAVGAEPVKPKEAPLEARPLRPTAETQAAIDAGKTDEEKDLFGRNGTVETTAQDVEDFKSNADHATAQPVAPGPEQPAQQAAVQPRQEQPAQQVAVQPRQEQPAQQVAVQPQQEQLAPGLTRSGSRSNILEFNGRRISQREFDRIQAKFLEGGGAQQPQAARPVQQPQVAANDVDDALKPNKLRQTTQVDSGRKDALGRPLDEYGRVIA